MIIDHLKINSQSRAVVNYINDDFKGKLVQRILPHWGAIGPGTTFNKAAQARISKDKAQQVAGQHDLTAFRDKRGLSGVLFGITDDDWVAQEDFKKVMLSSKSDWLEKLEGSAGYLGMSMRNLPHFDNPFVMRKRVSAQPSPNESEPKRSKGSFSYYMGKRKVRKTKRIGKGRRNKKFKISFAARVANVLNPPKVHSQETSHQIEVTVNCNIYQAEPAISPVAATQPNVIRPFLGFYDINDSIQDLFATASLPYEMTWVRSAVQYNELTNVSNTEMYVKIHRISCHVPKQLAADFFQSLYTFTRNTDNFPNTGNGATNVALLDQVVLGVRYSSESGSTTVNQPLQSLFSNRGLMERIRRAGWTVKQGKQMLMAPQQTFVWKQSLKKPFLWDPSYQMDNAVPVEMYQNKSSFYIIEVVGQTLKGSVVTQYVGSAPGTLIYANSTRYTFASRISAQQELYSDVPRIKDVAGNLAYSNTGVTFGPANNQPVPAV